MFLDRESGVHTEFSDPAGWSMMALPVQGMTTGLVVLAGRNLSSRDASFWISHRARVGTLFEVGLNQDRFNTTALND